MYHEVSWDAYCHNYLADLQLANCQYGIVDSYHVILRGSNFRDTWAWLSKPTSNSVELVEQIFVDRNRTSKN